MTASTPEPLRGPGPLTEAEHRKDLLLQDLAYWSECFWKNEEAGERRVQFYISLVTAVMAGLIGLYQYTYEQSHSLTEAAAVLIRAGVPGSAGLLLVGFITYLRMIRRNAVTDEYKERADAVRMLALTEADFSQLYEPGLKPRKARSDRERARRSVSNGGLSVTMAALNSLVLAILAGILVAPHSALWAWLAAVPVFVLAFLGHLRLALRLADPDRRDAEEREDRRRALLGWRPRPSGDGVRPA